VQPTEEDVEEYIDKNFVVKIASSANKRAKITKATKTTNTDVGNMIQNMDITMSDDTDIKTTLTTAPAHSAIKMNDSVSAIGKSSVSSRQKD
jgi:hypothetical protein